MTFQFFTRQRYTTWYLLILFRSAEQTQISLKHSCIGWNQILLIVQLIIYVNKKRFKNSKVFFMEIVKKKTKIFNKKFISVFCIRFSEINSLLTQTKRNESKQNKTKRVLWYLDVLKIAFSDTKDPKKGVLSECSVSFSFGFSSCVHFCELQWAFNTNELYKFDVKNVIIWMNQNEKCVEKAKLFHNNNNNLMERETCWRNTNRRESSKKKKRKKQQSAVTLCWFFLRTYFG